MRNFGMPLRGMNFNDGFAVTLQMIKLLQRYGEAVF